MKTHAPLLGIACLFLIGQQLHAAKSVYDPKLAELRKGRAIMLGKSVSKERKKALLTHVMLLSNWHGEDQELEVLREYSPINKVRLYESDYITDQTVDAMTQNVAFASLDLVRLENVTDDCLKPLTKAKNLQSLKLQEVDISDAGIKYLSQLKQLRKLTLWETKLTRRGVQELRAALPNCEIIFQLQFWPSTRQDHLILDFKQFELMIKVDLKDHSVSQTPKMFTTSSPSTRRSFLNLGRKTL